MSDEPSKTSGAAKRRRKFDAADAAAGLVPGGPDDGAWARDFARVGKPNLDDPGCDLDYVRRLQLVALRQMSTTPFPSQAQQNCWRRIREMSAVVGMTSNRAQLEAQVKKLKRALADRQQSASAVELLPGSSVQRPPTARGGRPPGPRPLGDPPPEETPAP